MSDDETKTGQTIDVPWLIDEGIEGPGKKPDWMPDKFKSVADMAKSYHELEKKVGVAPDKYDFSKSKYLDPDYEPFHELQNVARDKRVPQEVIDKMLESVDKYMDEFSVDYTEEINKLGDNAKDRIVTLDNWARANLSKEAYEGLTSSLNSANSVKALEELRGKMMSNTTPVPNGNEGGSDQTNSVESIRMEISSNFEKYKTDENYRKDLQRRLEVAVKNNPQYVDKAGG